MLIDNLVTENGATDWQIMEEFLYTTPDRFREIKLYSYKISLNYAMINVISF